MELIGNYTVIILLAVCLTQRVWSLVISPVPFGAVMTPQGEARTYSDLHEVVIARTHPAVERGPLFLKLYRQTYGLLRDMPAANESYVRTNDPNLKLTFEQRFRNLNWSLDSSEDVSLVNRRKRWALLEPVGSVAGNLFGLTTAKETKEIRDRLNQVIDNMGEQSKVVQGLTVAMHDTVANQKIIQAKVNQLIYSVDNMQTFIRTVVPQIEQRERIDIWRVQCYQIIESVLSLFETYKQEELNYEREYLLTKDFAEVGHVNEKLLSRSRLISILERIDSPLSPEYIYRNFKVNFITLTAERVGYIFTIPRMERELFYTWQVDTVPFLTPRSYQRIKPEL